MNGWDLKYTLSETRREENEYLKKLIFNNLTYRAKNNYMNSLRPSSASKNMKSNNKLPAIIQRNQQGIQRATVQASTLYIVSCYFWMPLLHADSSFNCFCLIAVLWSYMIYAVINILLVLKLFENVFVASHLSKLWLCKCDQVWCACGMPKLTPQVN